jgi:hypothetical protein
MGQRAGPGRRLGVEKIGGRMNRRRCPWCATVAGGRNQNLYISSENFIFLPFF